ncbi:hypothetical protein [Methylobacterium sp. sgz302541]|uniref:hypothetical protein n=1 Tax=unclassified Methylobacterium TaxID=2615210 RepID=UPI003D329643
MKYATVFDASSADGRHVLPLLVGIGLTLLGACLAFRPEWLERLGFPKPLPHRAFGMSFCLFAAFHTLVTQTAIWRSGADAGAAVTSNRCRTVEGRVAHFHPMPYAGHDKERFEVNGVPFAYSDYLISGGFNTSASHGGPIREGLPVRICHLDGLIVRLEIASE